MLFEKFGEFDSAEELNRAAAAQLAEGDIDAIYGIAEENGIDREDAEDYIDGAAPELCTPIMAALGKLKVEAAELEASCLKEAWSKNAWEDALKDKNAWYAGAWLDGRLVGCCGLWQSFEDADICNVAVDQTLRRQGIGEQLLLFLMEKMQ